MRTGHLAIRRRSGGVPARRPCRAGDSQLYRLILLALGALAAAVAVASDIEVLVISDLNSAYGSTDYEQPVRTAIARIVEMRPDLVLITGDMVAGQRRPHLSDTEIAAMWQAFDSVVAGPLRDVGIVLAATPGNHDASAYAGYSRERRAYADYWSSHRPALDFVDDRYYPYDYAFRLGDTLFVSLDATRPGALAAKQQNWLSQLLESHARDAGTRVIFSHLPLWPVATGRMAAYVGNDALESVLIQGRVNLALSGHHHAFYPGVKSGIAYISQACLGPGQRRLHGTGDRSPRAITRLQFSAAGIGVSALTGRYLDAGLPWDSLPERIQSDVAGLTRADLAESLIREADNDVD